VAKTADIQQVAEVTGHGYEWTNVFQTVICGAGIAESV